MKKDKNEKQEQVNNKSNKNTEKIILVATFIVFLILIVFMLIKSNPFDLVRLFLGLIGLVFNITILYILFRLAVKSAKTNSLEDPKPEKVDSGLLRKDVISGSIEDNNRGYKGYDKPGAIAAEVAGGDYAKGIVNEAGNVVRYKDGIGAEGIIAGKEYNQVDKNKDGRILISEVYPLTEAEVLEKILKVDEHFSKTEFKSFVKSVFMLIQKAWSNNDYLALRLLEADNLYYEHKVIIQDFIKKGIVDKREKIGIKGVLLKDFRVEGNKEILVVALTARMNRNFDETVFRSKDWTDRRTVDNDGDVPYIMTFVRKKGVRSHTRNLSNSNCPNCGATIDIKEDGICNYCNTSLVTGEVDWILVDIKNIELVEF